MRAWRTRDVVQGYLTAAHQHSQLVTHRSVCLTKPLVFNVMRQSTGVFTAQGVLSKYISQLRTNTARYTDERVRLAGEVIAGSLAVKMLGKPSSLEPLVFLHSTKHMLIVFARLVR